MKTAVVTGAAGFVGYHLVKKLHDEGVDVIAICRPESKHNVRLNEFKSIRLIECDSRQLLGLQSELKKYSPDVFYHLAWDGTTGELRGDYATQLVNVRNTCDAYTCAQAVGCRKFVAAGTVYELLSDQILSAQKFSALSYYVLAKRFACESLVQLSKKVGLDFTWCMFCQPIGRFIKLNQLMAYMINELKNGRMPTFGTAQNPFDMMVVEDLAQALYITGDTKLSCSRYYIGSGHVRVLKDYLMEAGAIVAPQTQLLFGGRPDDGLVFSYEWLNSEPFMRETGFECTHSFEDGVRSVADWIDECNTADVTG